MRPKQLTEPRTAERGAGEGGRTAAGSVKYSGSRADLQDGSGECTATSCEQQAEETSSLVWKEVLDAQRSTE